MKQSTNLPTKSNLVLVFLVFMASASFSQQILSFNKDSSVVVTEQDIVIGYDTQNTKTISSAITSVKSENFNVGNIYHPLQLIQGRVAGLQIARSGNLYNDVTYSRLRGVTTINGTNYPLIIIDGIISTSLDMIEANDIASFTIIKDGSAAAIYGSRAAPGVILINRVVLL